MQVRAYVKSVVQRCPLHGIYVRQHIPNQYYYRWVLFFCVLCVDGRTKSFYRRTVGLDNHRYGRPRRRKGLPKRRWSFLDKLYFDSVTYMYTDPSCSKNTHGVIEQNRACGKSRTASLSVDTFIYGSQSLNSNNGWTVNIKKDCRSVASMLTRR